MKLTLKSNKRTLGEVSLDKTRWIAMKDGFMNADDIDVAITANGIISAIVISTSGGSIITKGFFSTRDVRKEDIIRYSAGDLTIDI